VTSLERRCTDKWRHVAATSSKKLRNASNSLRVAHWFAGPAIGTVFAYLKGCVRFFRDYRNGTGIHAFAELLALILINFVHTASEANKTGMACLPQDSDINLAKCFLRGCDGGHAGV